MIYGCKLENANYEKRNAEAIDLVDRKNRITVQVTRDNEHYELQKKINMYIKHELYNDYDRLVFLLLKEKINYKKAFDTTGGIRF